ncbi:MAG: hypothetical protein V4697_03675 [Patescibacteria group bacterium]
MSIKNIVKTTVVVSLFVFAFLTVTLSVHAQTYVNTGNEPAYTSYGTYLPEDTEYEINGVSYTANGSNYIPTGTVYTVDGVRYVGGVIGAQPQGTPSTATGAGNYTYVPAGTVYTVNGTAYANSNGTYVPNGSTYTVNGVMYVANGGTYYSGMPGGVSVIPTIPTTPTFPSTGLGGNASLNWSILLAIAFVGAIGAVYMSRRNESFSR